MPRRSFGSGCFWRALEKHLFREKRGGAESPGHPWRRATDREGPEAVPWSRRRRRAVGPLAWLRI